MSHIACPVVDRVCFIRYRAHMVYASTPPLGLSLLKSDFVKDSCMVPHVDVFASRMIYEVFGEFDRTLVVVEYRSEVDGFYSQFIKESTEIYGFLEYV